MYFQILHRSNSQSGEYDGYCCLKESFRDAAGTTHKLSVRKQVLRLYERINTIRHKHKAHGDNRYWTVIHRVMSTQKTGTSTAVNALGEEAKMRICTRLTLAAVEIYKRPGYRPTPFRKPKSVLHKCTNDKTQKVMHQIVSG